MLKRMLLAYLTLVKSFKKPFGSLPLFIGILFLRCLSSIANVLDVLFFPSLKKVKIKEPIIVVGNPRSGTTFLQRFLTDNHVGAGLQLWKMLFPSLTIQKLIKNLIPKLEKISPARHHANAAHKTSLMAVETDDPALLFRYFDGFFVYAFFMTWAEKDYKKDFDPAFRATSRRDFDWLEKIWRKNLYSENSERVVAKLFSLGMRLPDFLQHFPDAKVLYTIRDPLETVPSGLSLVTGVLDGWFGFWNLSADRREFFIERIYSALLELSMRFHDDYVSGAIPNNKIMVVPFKRMMTDLDNLMPEIFDFAGINANNELLNTVAQTSAEQKQFKSSHKYSLEKFGLSAERIVRDYSKIYSTFQLDLPE